MSEGKEEPLFERTDRPRKMRTWWHPLLIRLLDRSLSNGYEV